MATTGAPLRVASPAVPGRDAGRTVPPNAVPLSPALVGAATANPPGASGGHSRFLLARFDALAGKTPLHRENPRPQITGPARTGSPSAALFVVGAVAGLSFFLLCTMTPNQHLLCRGHEAERPGRLRRPARGRVTPRPVRDRVVLRPAGQRQGHPTTGWPAGVCQGHPTTGWPAGSCQGRPSPRGRPWTAAVLGHTAGSPPRSRSVGWLVRRDSGRAAGSPEKGRRGGRWRRRRRGGEGAGRVPA